jgi:hypothetical protein
VSEALMGSIKVVFKKWKKGTVQSDKNKINTTNETEYMKEMVMCFILSSIKTNRIVSNVT